ncbi:MAG TPA: CDP-alcohol phosphatidyltransferase family protein [Chitinophagaceae bacterium]|nr:CDP-alcohol phosphatidyltransferase family protein [Chitinophagaceae bacterium]HNU14486.1 CDP-alcohol phosphatidyltransferase family protein [Chitinophagaceae bacterium]
MNNNKQHLSYYVINGITLYRIVTAPLLLVLLFLKQYDLFKWLLAVSFFTDLIDGFLARKYKVTSILGTKLDSIGDDLTVAVAVTGLFVIFPEFIRQQKWVFIILLALFLIQMAYAFTRYGKMTNFHTWLAKTAALLQGIFLLLTFFTGQPYLLLFYTAAIVTMLELIEEIILVYLLPEWKMNVRGLYWVLTRKKAV